VTGAISPCRLRLTGSSWPMIWWKARAEGAGLAGPGGVLARLTERVPETALDAEMIEGQSSPWTSSVHKQNG
jgi:hypothetical protein